MVMVPIGTFVRWHKSDFVRLPKARFFVCLLGLLGLSFCEFIVKYQWMKERVTVAERE
jgi:hypothetical protein